MNRFEAEMSGQVNHGRVRSTKPKSLEAGVSLLEVLVAMTIMAMSFGVLYSLLGGSTRQVHEASVVTRASLLAGSVLGMYESLPSATFSADGQLGEEFAWSLTTEPYESELQQQAQTSLGLVRIVVRWGGGGHARQYILITVKPIQPEVP